MNAEKFQQWVADANDDAIENAWMEGIERGDPLEEMRDALEVLVRGERVEMAQTLGWLLLSDAMERLPVDEMLDVARIILPALPGNDELRLTAVDLYRAAYGQVEHFDAFLRESGLEGNQSLRRAVQTLDTCLAILPGDYLANRFDQRVVRVEGFQEVLGQFQLVSPTGVKSEMEPKPLADEFGRVDEGDFRVLSGFCPEKLPELLTGDPAEALIGICMAHAGRIEAPELKELLVGRYMDAKEWSKWWGRARSAARRSGVLSVEGRPAVVSYHPHGRSIEEEFAAAVARAVVPADHLAVLRDYLRETKHRKAPMDRAFVGPIMEKLSEQAASLEQARPGEALAASLGIAAAVEQGAPAPRATAPSAREMLARAARPAETVAGLTDAQYWPAALEALAARPDAGAHLAKLLVLAPAGQLDAVVGHLRAAGGEEALDEAVAAAMLDPTRYLHLCLWLWGGPAEGVPSPPSKLDLLSRLLGVMEDLQRDPDVDRERRRTAFGQIRSALVAGDGATFRAAVAETDKDVVETIKRRVDRSDGLTAASREALLAIVREEHYALFLQEKVDPWLDEGVLWTTAEALSRREAELKDLFEVQMPANSRAIGEAASHGDLSENSEWQFAIEEQRRLQARAVELREDLARARVLHPADVPGDRVAIGSRVVLRRASDGAEFEVNLLGPWDTDVRRRIYSYKTPLALSLLGKEVGDAATLKLDGDEKEYTIERTGPAVAGGPANAE